MCFFIYSIDVLNELNELNLTRKGFKKAYSEIIDYRINKNNFRYFLINVLELTSEFRITETDLSSKC